MNFMSDLNDTQLIGAAILSSLAFE